VNAAQIAEVLDRALALAASGVPVFPCRPDKAPACPHGFRDATADLAALRELWRRHPGALIGMATGAASGIDVLDIDSPRHAGAAEWLAARSVRLPATRAHRTRSGGVHLLFQHRPGMRCWAGRPVAGIDGRADGGYIVHWPAAGLPVLCDAVPAPWPGWLIAELMPPPPTGAPAAPWRAPAASADPRAASSYAAAALRRGAERVARAPLGTRNATLNAECFSLARLIVAGCLDGQTVADALAAAAFAAGLPPREITATLRSGFIARGLRCST
jgi:hypothetical protein